MGLDKYDAQIEEIAKKDPGYLLSRDVREANIPSPNFLDFLSRHPEYEKQERGVYVDESVATPDKFYLLSYHKNVTYSHMSALYLHGLTGEHYLPDTYEITVPYAYNLNRMKGKNPVNNFFEEGRNLIVHQVYTKELNKGREEVTTPLGHKVVCYCADRAICEVVKNKNSYEMSLFKTVLKAYFSKPDLNSMRLAEYASMFEISDQMFEYMNLLR